MPGIGQFINDFADDMEDAVDKVHKDTFIDVMEDANTPVASGGRMPVATGTLRESITGCSDGGLATGSASYQTAIRSASKNSPLQGGWQAEYAPYVEFGNRGTPPRAFARGATLRFREFLRKNANNV